MKKDRNFFLSFFLYLNIFVNFETIQYYNTCNLLFYFVHRYNQLHSSDSPNSTYNDLCQVNGWEALSLQLLFEIF